MITFLDLGFHGRMTNQIFQYAALRSVALYNGYEMKIPDVTGRVCWGQSNKLHNFNISCSILTDEDVKSIRHYYEEPYANEFVYHESVFEIQDFTSIKGFFQHPKYFERYASELRKECSLKAHIMEKSSAKISEIKSRFPNRELVCLHVRRGDAIPLWDKIFPSVASLMEFIAAAKSYFPNAVFLVFSGGNKGEFTHPEAYEFCRKTFQGDEYVFIEHNEEVVDMGMMVLCDHYIVPFFTSFSLWPMFLNTSPTKKSIFKDGNYNNTVFPRYDGWIYL